jgi:hypothetical protein
MKTDYSLSLDLREIIRDDHVSLPKHRFDALVQKAYNQHVQIEALKAELEGQLPQAALFDACLNLDHAIMEAGSARLIQLVEDCMSQADVQKMRSFVASEIGKQIISLIFKEMVVCAADRVMKDCRAMITAAQENDDD